MLRFDV